MEIGVVRDDVFPAFTRGEIEVEVVAGDVEVRSRRVGTVGVGTSDDHVCGMGAREGAIVFCRCEGRCVYVDCRRFRLQVAAFDFDFSSWSANQRVKNSKRRSDRGRKGKFTQSILSRKTQY